MAQPIDPEARKIFFAFLLDNEQIDSQVWQRCCILTDEVRNVLPNVDEHIAQMRDMAAAIDAALLEVVQRRPRGFAVLEKLAQQTPHNPPTSAPAPAGAPQASAGTITVTGDRNVTAGRDINGSITQEEHVESKYTFNTSGGNNAFVFESTLRAAQIFEKMPGANQTERDELTQLVNTMHQLLKQVPEENRAKAEEVALQVEALANAASTPEPNTEATIDSGQKLIRAAETVASVVPKILTVAMQIIHKLGLDKIVDNLNTG